MNYWENISFFHIERVRLDQHFNLQKKLVVKSAIMYTSYLVVNNEINHSIILADVRILSWIYKKTIEQFLKCMKKIIQ